MAKTRKHRSRKTHKRNIIGNLKKTTRRVVPAVKSGLKTVGTKVEQTASKTKPYVEKGISSVYGVLSEGFNLGVKGVEKVIKTKSKKSRKSRKSRK
jgi:hypothetical protein